MSAPTRVTSLDGLRGLAALLVLVHHSLLTMSGFSAVYWGVPEPWFVTPFAHTPLHLFWAGGEAVLVFFVLSGVVLTLPATRARGIAWRSYYPSRLIRLYIPVIAAVLFAVLCATIWPRTVTEGYSEWLRAHGQPITPATVLKDMALVDGTSWLNSPLWSLRWEVVFSLLLPVYVWIALRFGRRRWALIACSLAVLSAAGSALGSDALRYLPYFGVGSLIAVNMTRIARTAERVFAGRTGRGGEILVGAIAALLLTYTWWGPSTPGAMGAAVRSLPVLAGVMLVVLLSIASPGARRFLSSRALMGLGTISFSLYLTHEPIVVSLAVMMPPDRSWIAPLLGLPICVGVAWVFWRLIERPSHRLARTASQALAHRRIAPPSGQVDPRDGSSVLGRPLRPTATPRGTDDRQATLPEPTNDQGEAR